MNAEHLSTALAKLTEEAEQLVTSNPSAQQVVVVLTAKGNMYHCINQNVLSGDTADEEAFAKLLVEKEETEIKYAVCMWHDRSHDVPFWPWPLDVPSWYLREQLKQINPLNEETSVFLQTEGGYCARTLKELVPPKK